MKRLAFARQTDPSDRIPMPGLCRDFGRDWEGNEKDGGIECLDPDDPHWRHLIETGVLTGIPTPVAADQFAPVEGFEGPVRRAFQAFGLAADDEATWRYIKRHVDLIAREYNRLSSPEAIPKPSDIRTQLKDVKKAANDYAAALAALSEPALDWMLAFDPPSPLHPRSREGNESPGQAPVEFLRIREAALGTDLAEYADTLIRWANAPVNEDQTRYLEAFSALRRVAATADADEIEDARRNALRLKALGMPIPPAPYYIRDRLVGKARAIAALAKKAQGRAAEHGPANPSNKTDKKVLGRTPRDWLIECCLDLIERIFGADGLRKIRAYRADRTREDGEALFTGLLRAVQQYATGKEPSSFSEAVNQIRRLRDERLLPLGAARASEKTAE